MLKKEIETFLQRDYKEQWIDGALFLYNGEKCEYDHVPNLSATKFRNK